MQIVTSRAHAFIFCFFLHNRERRGLQEASAINHMHRHGDQLSGHTLHGSVLPEQVSKVQNPQENWVFYLFIFFISKRRVLKEMGV